MMEFTPFLMSVMEQQNTRRCLQKILLLNYKRKGFGSQQVAVIIRSSDLEERIREGILLSLDAFIA